MMFSRGELSELARAEWFCRKHVSHYLWTQPLPVLSGTPTAYGDPNHVDVMYLRQFRDTVLNQSAPGRAFVAWYWHTGPKLARLIGWSAILRSTARFGIHGLVIVLQRMCNIQTH
ncbi:CFI-box-CTERM domain-containing protein [Paraburkholderia madseniana]|uniref:CFI-box-CTERM domain-containing protein n=1 Tax=Paraburkholderia madseniana TaxID=2599607 RepID=UPI0039C999A4